MKIILAVALVAILTGCGSTGSKTTYQEEEIAEPEIPVSNGNVLVVSGNDGDTGISYTDVGDGSVLIDCGDGGCGDVYVASPVTEDNSDNSDSSDNSTNHPDEEEEE